MTEYYWVRRMRVILNGMKVGNGDRACYFRNRAFFSKIGLTRKNALHELYHPPVEMKGLELPEQIEEKQASRYASEFVKKP